MATAMVQVGEPPDAFNLYELGPVLIHSPPCCIKRVAVRHLKLAITTGNAWTKLQFVALKVRKDHLVFNCVQIANYEQLLFVLHQLGYVLAEEGKRRVGDHDVSLFQECDALVAAEVAAFGETCAVVGGPLQEQLDVFDTGRAVFVDILHFLDLDGNCLGLLALTIALEIIIESEFVCRRLGNRRSWW